MPKHPPETYSSALMLFLMLDLMLLAETCSLILVPCYSYLLLIWRAFSNLFPILPPKPFLYFLLTLRSRNSEPKEEVVTCSCLWDPRSYNPEFAGVCPTLEQFSHHSSTKGIVLSPLPRSQGDYHLNPEQKEKNNKHWTISLRFLRSCDTNTNIFHFLFRQLLQKAILPFTREDLMNEELAVLTEGFCRNLPWRAENPFCQLFSHARHVPFAPHHWADLHSKVSILHYYSGN